MVKSGYKQTEIGVIPEDWEVNELGNIGNVNTGMTPATNNRNFYGEEYYFVSPSDLGKGKYILNSEKKLSKLGFSIARKYPKNSILFTCIGSTIGKAGISLFELTSNQQINAVLPNDLYSSDFVYYFLTFISPKIKLGASEQAVPMINKTEFSKTQIPLPPLAEQQAIAEALSDADAWIESLEQLIAKKRLLKQGAMQELLTPKEDWEVRKLGEVLQFGSGKDYKHLSIGDIPVYGTGGIMTMVNDYLYDGESVGIGRKGTIDKPVFLKGKFWTVDTLFFSHSFSNTLPKYIYYQFLQIPWKEYNEASGVPSLNKKTLEQIEISMPSITEQTRIAAILSDMDLEIETFEKQLEKARQIKQGMMQELLTGRIRLV
ncbi:restriction endonuclease subunit S [Flavobacterium sp. TMP13]|uniref:restriction endonuclease subunit S n=1 Tax=Flavobacterium sp. TMP13 TaxID=3425950 RepID=UPI003D7809B6